MSQSVLPSCSAGSPCLAPQCRCSPRGGWQYTVIENVLQGDALRRVLDAVAVTPGGRGRHAVCEEIRELMEHEAILPLVVDVAGWNIQCRECILGKQPPKAGEKAPDRLAAAWHFGT